MSFITSFLIFMPIIYFPCLTELPTSSNTIELMIVAILVSFLILKEMLLVFTLLGFYLFSFFRYLLSKNYLYS